MEEPGSKRRVLASAWWQVALLTFLFGFGVLSYLAYRIYADHAPIPARVTGAGGEVLFTRDDVLDGQSVFGKYGLMEHGTIFGHGAYLGPDFTADYLERARASMLRTYAGAADPGERVREDMKQNRFDAASGTLVFTPAQATAFRDNLAAYRGYFGPPDRQEGVRRPYLHDDAELRSLVSYFAWAAWAATANRPGESYSYTNNWPPQPDIGNRPTADAVFWSALSLVALLAGIGATLFAFGRWQKLGWHRDTPSQAQKVAFRDPDRVRLLPAQRATVWYFAVVVGLFLAQGICGGANAHYHADPTSFFGFDVAGVFPYHLTRTWHLQLAIFFVAASYLAMGIFLAPMIAGSEPRHQRTLALALFAALVVVVVGSLAGEYLSLQGHIRSPRTAWWVGAQGWEYLDLGRMWQIALVVGLVLWTVIMARGLRPMLAKRDASSMPWLFLYASFSIPLFYGAGLIFGPRPDFAVMDFWRFWVVHLWVEDFLELFTTITVAYIFVLLGMVSEVTATRLIYLDVILYSVGGVIGTMHHLYFSGAPSVLMAFGAFFSAMEVIPLVLLTYEAFRFMRLGGAAPDETVMDTSEERFPHKWAVMFLAAVGFWNFVGAGIFGFLINLPIVSYWEIGTQFTANHAHASMMGVYGMLAVAFLVFVARYFVPRDEGAERAMKWSFWSLNVGLGWMVCLNLLPIGAMQFYDALEHGYAHARSPAFYGGTAVHVLEWLRFPGDVLFIVGGILPLVYLSLRMIKLRTRPGEIAAGEGAEALIEEA